MSSLEDTPLPDLQTQLIDLERSYNISRRQVAAAMRQVRAQEEQLGQNFYAIREAYLKEINQRLGHTPNARPMIYRAYLVARLDQKGKVDSYGIYSEERPSPMVGEKSSRQLVIDTAESVINYDAAVTELIKKMQSAA